MENPELLQASGYALFAGPLPPLQTIRLLWRVQVDQDRDSSSHTLQPEQRLGAPVGVSMVVGVPQ